MLSRFLRHADRKYGLRADLAGIRDRRHHEQGVKTFAVVAGIIRSRRCREEARDFLGRSASGLLRSVRPLWNCQRPSAFSRLALVTERMIVPIHDSRSVTILVEQLIGAKESDAKPEIGAYYWTHALSFRPPSYTAQVSKN
jgi:hypothetical protein